MAADFIGTWDQASPASPVQGKFYTITPHTAPQHSYQVLIITFRFQEVFHSEHFQVA